MSEQIEEMLSIREVCRFFGGREKPLDQSTIYRWIQRGILPRAVRMGSRTMRWKRSDCQSLLDKMESTSRQKENI